MASVESTAPAARRTHLWKRALQCIGLVALAAILRLIPSGDVRITGDGPEYVMMAHGFRRHATPEVKPSDIAAMHALPDAVVPDSHPLKKDLAAIAQQLRRQGGMPLGFADGGAWGIQAIHFWMYPLLATPFYALAVALGLSAALAFALLNFTIVAVTIGCVLRWYPRLGVAGAVAVAALGPDYYLRWTGPEVFSACCALLATLAIARRDFALAAALAGFGATQNPAVAGLIAAAGAYKLVLMLRPDRAPTPAPRRSAARNAALVAAGILLAALPYAYNQAVFGMPSIIAAYYTNPYAVSWERFLSLFFDLDQGMAVGFPGLVLGLLLLPFCLDRAVRARWLAHAAGALLLTAGLALPTLAAVNWNCAHFIVIRYASWVAMPLVAALLLGLARLPDRRRLGLAACVVVCQAIAIRKLGGMYGSGHLAHAPLGAWVLDHAPRFYDPDPEIFAERERHEERDATPEDVFVHRGPHGPTKLMRYWANTGDTGGVCPPGQAILSPGTRMPTGWVYYDAPFRCGPAAAQGADWVVDTAHGAHAALLGEGWSHLEDTGVWTDGPRSVLRIPVPQGAALGRLALAGSYFYAGMGSDVTINGVHLGRLRLGAAPIVLPAALRHAGTLEIVLVHDVMASKERYRMSSDPRRLAFFLHRIHLDR